ncbi:amidohydrolase [Rhodoferax lacus]|uniref:Amidohydrolase n=1 Tax=Rhodoferax lacus TaxID=2184758 RepID=A0A3E1RBI5_9BURK|nr:amidohydrolase family protein [Rhodoferax lacus]RFO96709.1 amidohydrolase [Rhodoferax lacus]
MNKRNFMQTALAAASTLGVNAIAQEKAPKLACQCGLVDVHSHFLTPVYYQALADAKLINPDGGFPVHPWSETLTLAHMDKHNIETSILSVSTPSVGFLKEPQERQKLARNINDFAGDLVRRQPRRLGAFATLPLPDMPAALEELAYALDYLKLDGIVLETNVHGIYLGDPRLDPLFAELNRRKAKVLLHPTAPECIESLGLGRPAPILEFPLDTTRTVTDLIFAGTLVRYPDIRMIIPHAGGALTALAHRLASFSTLPFLKQKPAGGAAEVRKVLASLYYDLAGSATEGTVQSLRQLTTLSHVLFGSDYPYTPAAGIAANVEGFRNLQAVSDKEHEDMARNNALGLFTRLASNAAASQ